MSRSGPYFRFTCDVCSTEKEHRNRPDIFTIPNGWSRIQTGLNGGSLSSDLYADVCSFRCLLEFAIKHLPSDKAQS